MQSNRVGGNISRPIIILNQAFAVTKELNVKDSGLMEIVGVIEGERLDLHPDGQTEILVKTIRINKAQLIKTKDLREV